MRNLATRVGRRHLSACLALAKTIFAQETHTAAIAQREIVAKALRQANQHAAADFLVNTDDILNYMLFPNDHWTKLHSTNVVERPNRELKRRTRVVSTSPTAPR